MDRKITRVTPPLVRKQMVVKSPVTVRVVVEPSKQKTTTISQANIPQARPVNQPIPPRSQQVPQKNVVTPRSHNLVKRSAKSAGVKYITADITQDSLERIKAIKNKGYGRLLIIVGNGPTLNEVDTSLLRNHSRIDTLSINKPDQRLWPTTYWSFFDMSQLRRHEDLWNSYNGIIFNSTAIKRQKQNGIQVKNIGGKGFSKDLTKGLNIGRSSVFASMQIALWLNYDHVYILGCDMNADGIDGKLHFYGTNPDVDPTVRKERFAKEAEYYDYAANILGEEDCKKFTFVSSHNHWPFVTRYNKLDHVGSANKIIEHADKLVLNS